MPRCIERKKETAPHGRVAVRRRSSQGATRSNQGLFSLQDKKNEAILPWFKVKNRRVLLIKNKDLGSLVNSRDAGDLDSKKIWKLRE